MFMEWTKPGNLFYFKLLGIALFLMSCGGGPHSGSNAKPPVILISIDTLRSDRLPFYGFNNVKTPALQSLVDDSLLFEKAFAHTPLTLPSHASMFTGQLPYRHGVRGNLGYALGPDKATLAEQFKAEGYRTGAVVSSMVLRRSVGLDQGFDFYDDNMPETDGQKIGNYATRLGADSIARAQEWLSQPGTEPPFLFLHLYDPHAPYQPPPPYEESYEGEIAYTDAILGDFFNFLKEKGLYKSALILLVSDHGEGLGDHGEREHGMFLYREALQVPFILKLPQNRKSGKTVSQPVGLIDVAPTLADGSGIASGIYDGISVLGSIPDRTLYAESHFAKTHYGWHLQQSALDGEWHYIEGSAPQLYDMKRDMPEMQNLYGSKAVPPLMLKIIEEGREGLDSRVGISQEDREMLASLGYVGSFGPDSDIQSLSEADFIALVEEVAEARSLVNREREVVAAGRLKDLLEKYPSILDARLLLSGLLMEDEEYEQAEFVLLEGLAQAPEHIDLLINLAETEMELDKQQEAVKVAERAMKVDPVKAGAVLVRPFFENGHFDLAGQMAQIASDGGAQSGFIFYVLGRVASMKGEVEKSLTHFELADAILAQQPTNDVRVATLVFLGEGYLALNKTAPGLEALQKALQLNPTSGNTRAVLAEAMYSTGKKEEARRLLDEGLSLKPFDPPIMEALIGMAIGNGNEAEAWNIAQNFLKGKRELAVEPLCKIFIAMGKADLAEKSAKLILETLPNSGPPHVVLGRISHGQKDFKTAAYHFQKALEYMDEEESAGSWVEQALFHLGDGAAIQGNPSAAAEYFKRAMTLNPGSPNIRVALTVLYAQVGQPEVAKSIMKDWLNRYPSINNTKTATQTLKRLGL